MALLPTTDQIWRPHREVGTGSSMSQTGKRPGRRRDARAGGFTLPAVFRSASAAPGWISGSSYRSASRISASRTSLEGSHRAVFRPSRQ
jgi:hypothetical protein